MQFVNTIFRWFIAAHYRRVEEFMRYPIETQNRIFYHLIEVGRSTEWGKKHNFNTIKSIDDFKKQVPISTYDDIKPYIERMMNGESDILWRGKTKWFSKSSGTTSDKSKYIPVTDENLETCHLKAGHDIMASWYNNFPNTKLYTGKLMAMGGTYSSYDKHSYTMIGDVSAIMMESMPFYAKSFFAPSLDLALMNDWGEKIERMAQEVIHENITSISGVPTWTLVLFRRIAEIKKTNNLLEVWPNFEMYVHGGVDFTPYREQFRAYFPSPKVHFVNAYNASEGFFAAQLDADDDNSEMVLLVDNGIFYEFLPEYTTDDVFAPTLQLNEVKLNVNYALIITTNAGLWRYNIGDTVRFTALNPFKIVVTGRTKHFINVFGEEVMVENTDLAVARTCVALGCAVKEYTVAPIFMDTAQGGHEWAIAFVKPPIDAAAFAALLDINLQAVNSDYEAKRHKDLALCALKLNVVHSDTFYTWLRGKGKMGGQHKIQRLSNTRTFLEEILALNK